MDSDPWVYSNQRRLELVDKLFDAGLSPAEYAELHELQTEAGRMARLNPLPKTEEPAPWTRRDEPPSAACSTGSTAGEP